MSPIDALWPALRSAIFLMDAETAHEWTMDLLASAPRTAAAMLGPWLGGRPEALREVGGVRWRNPVGLAAGLDKDGRAIAFWSHIGFGAVEVGTVTAKAQPGNDRPRLWRLPEHRALVNRLGFNNRGSEALASTLRTFRERGGGPVPVGANVGKSKVTPNESATEDYVTSIERLAGLVEWFTVNVSSPHTPGLRDLQAAASLRELLPRAVDAAQGTPVWLKIAPDLDDEGVVDAIEAARHAGVRAIVATNTTLRRTGVDTPHPGGMSGRPLYPLATATIERAIAQPLPVIGAGGIDGVERARERLDAGCVAVMVYSALVFEGPGLPSRITRGLA